MENLFNTLNTVNITTNIKTYNKENYFQLLKEYENKSDITRVNKIFFSQFFSKYFSNSEKFSEIIKRKIPKNLDNEKTNQILDDENKLFEYIKKEHNYLFKKIFIEKVNYSSEFILSENFNDNKIDFVFENLIYCKKTIEKMLKKNQANYKDFESENGEIYPLLTFNDILYDSLSNFLFINKKLDSFYNTLLIFKQYEQNNSVNSDISNFNLIIKNFGFETIKQNYYLDLKHIKEINDLDTVLQKINSNYFFNIDSKFHFLNLNIDQLPSLSNRNKALTLSYDYVGDFNIRDLKSFIEIDNLKSPSLLNYVFIKEINMTYIIHLIYNKNNFNNLDLFKNVVNLSLKNTNLNIYDIVQEMKNIKNNLYINNKKLNSKYDLEKVDSQIDLIINTINDLFFPKVNVNKIKKIGRI